MCWFIGTFSINKSHWHSCLIPAAYNWLTIDKLLNCMYHSWQHSYIGHFLITDKSPNKLGSFLNICCFSKLFSKRSTAASNVLTDKAFLLLHWKFIFNKGHCLIAWYPQLSDDDTTRFMIDKLLNCICCTWQYSYIRNNLITEKDYK